MSTSEFCAEGTQDGAVICRYCRAIRVERLENPVSGTPDSPTVRPTPTRVPFTKLRPGICVGCPMCARTVKVGDLPSRYCDAEFLAAIAA